VGLALPGILLFAVIAALIAAVAAWKVAGAVDAWWSAGPNYTPAATASCLRHHGYAISRVDGYGYPGIRASRGQDYLDAYFTPNTHDADHLAVRIYSAIERRNVVFDSMVELPRDGPIVACLRTQ